MARKKQKLSTQCELLNIKTGEIVKKSIKEILNDLNKDRNDLWMDYNETDYEEGLKFFTDYIVLKPKAV